MYVNVERTFSIVLINVHIKNVALLGSLRAQRFNIHPLFYCVGDFNYPHIDWGVPSIANLTAP